MLSNHYYQVPVSIFKHKIRITLCKPQTPTDLGHGGPSSYHGLDPIAPSLVSGFLGVRKRICNVYLMPRTINTANNCYYVNTAQVASVSLSVVATQRPPHASRLSSDQSLSWPSAISMSVMWKMGKVKTCISFNGFQK